MDRSEQNVIGAILDTLLGPQGHLAVMLKDIRDSNAKIASLLHNSRVAPMAEKLYDPVNNRIIPEKLCEDEGCPHHGTPHVCVEPAATPNHYERLWRAAKSVALDGLAYKTDGKDHVPRPAKPPITREQVERCILRATDQRHMIPTYSFADAVDNVMELINGR